VIAPFFIPAQWNFVSSLDSWTKMLSTKLCAGVEFDD
jgi:hypothetical protein